MRMLKNFSFFNGLLISYSLNPSYIIHFIERVSTSDLSRVQFLNAGTYFHKTVTFLKPKVKAGKGEGWDGIRHTYGNQVLIHINCAFAAFARDVAALLMCFYHVCCIFFFSKGNYIFNFPLLSSWSREDNWCGFTAKCPVAVEFHSELWRQQRTWLEIWKRGGAESSWPELWPMPTSCSWLQAYLPCTDIPPPEGNFWCFEFICQFNESSFGFRFYLLSLVSLRSFVSLTVRFIIFATCQFVTYLSDSWSFPHSTSLRVHYACPGKALRL